MTVRAPTRAGSSRSIALLLILAAGCSDFGSDVPAGSGGTRIGATLRVAWSTNDGPLTVEGDGRADRRRDAPSAHQDVGQDPPAAEIMGVRVGHACPGAGFGRADQQHVFVVGQRRSEAPT